METAWVKLTSACGRTQQSCAADAQRQASSMEHLTSISSGELKEDPDAKIWALIIHIGENAKLQEDSRFKSFWQVYIYDAEVLNGGHLQYFVNQETLNVKTTIEALKSIGANQHAEILEDCYNEIKSKEIPIVTSLEQYSELAETSSFIQDSKYYSIKPEVFELLEKHYASQIENWVTVDA